MKRRQFLSFSLAMCCGLTLGADPDYRYRCPTRSSLTSATGASKWAKTHLTYYMKRRDTGDMKRYEWDRCWMKAFQSWSDITPLTFEKIYDDSADIIIDVSKDKDEGFGRRGDVLAWAYLPSTQNGTVSS